MLLRSVYFTLRRMLRGYMGYVYLIALPLGIITINGLALGDMTDELGRRGMDMIAVGVVIGFQLVGGFYSMEMLRGDLFSSAKWRLFSLPYPLHKHVFAILISSTLFCLLNGAFMVLFTLWVFDVAWGNVAWALFVLTLVSLVSQLFFMMAMLGIRKYRSAELIGYAYVFTFLILAGYFFLSVPDIEVVRWINRYINPLSLGETAIVNLILDLDAAQAYFSVLWLLVEAVIIGMIVIYLGRRRLA